MLSLEQLKELGRFKMLMRKIHNVTVHIERFLSDTEYQSQMLDIGEEFDENDLENDELIMLTLVIRSKFGRLSIGEGNYNPVPPVAPKATSSDQIRTQKKAASNPDAEQDASTEEESKPHYFGGLR
jgi:hypothetical protein